MARRWKWCCIPAALVVLGGCGPKIAKDQLGELVFDGQQMPGYDQEYPLPQLPSEHEDQRARMMPSTP